MPRLPSIILGLIPLVVLCVRSDPAWAQGGLRQSLERMDRNDNGVLEPDEITPLARPFLERLSRATRSFELDEPNPIPEIQEIARRYYAIRNGAQRGERIRIDRDSTKTVLPFGRKHDEPLVPDFGLAEVKFPYTQDDLDFADRTLRSHDENKDGFIDRFEASRHEWTHRNPFADDLNKDERLSRLEMAQRYARRRLLDESAGELRKKDWREREMQPRQSSARREDPSSWWRRGGSDYWLTASLLGRFDLNRNGILEPSESKNLGVPVVRVDSDRDGNLSRSELFAYLKTEQDNAGGSTEAPPEWFAELDANRDGQVELREFATEWTDAKLAEFGAMDSNEDGLLTVAEANRSGPTEQSKHRNDEPQLLAPRRTIISEIEVEEDVVIGDLNVQLSITHTSTGNLDGYLTGPDGTRIELFTAIGGSGDHFDNTTFDDQSAAPIVKAKPPYRGAFIPEGLSKKQPSLAYFNGKNARGMWQLVIRATRSQRYGVLHGWRLQLTPQAPTVGATNKTGTTESPAAELPLSEETPSTQAPTVRPFGEPARGETKSGEIQSGEIQSGEIQSGEIKSKTTNRIPPPPVNR